MLAVTYLRSYGLKYAVTSIDGNMVIVTFTVTNSSTISSATHPPVIGYTNWWNKNIGDPINKSFSSGPFSKTTQTFIWMENLKWK
ncbi:hypothetical protein HDC90_004473 [Pedobacter sp. AK013]|nr:hypothetical protein [Pedobacter sp. AK013]